MPLQEALLVVDIQNDFCPGGALGVPEGDAIIPLVNRLMQEHELVALTQDWHPRGHLSFASSHAGANAFSTTTMPYGEQVLWPDHCVQGTAGAAFHADLDLRPAQLIIRKGMQKAIDSYSAFRENDHRTRTGLAGWLRERGVERVVLCGLATDFCVLWSAQDARAEGFEVTVRLDACRGIDLDGSVARALAEMQQVGVTLQPGS